MRVYSYIFDSVFKSKFVHHNLPRISIRGLLCMCVCGKNSQKFMCTERIFWGCIRWRRFSRPSKPIFGRIRKGKRERKNKQKGRRKHSSSSGQISLRRKISSLFFLQKYAVKGEMGVSVECGPTNRPKNEEGKFCSNKNSEQRFAPNNFSPKHGILFLFCMAQYCNIHYLACWHSSFNIPNILI